MSGVTEQRLTQRLKTYWDLIRKAQLMPQIEHFNTSAIDDLWHQCMQISVDTRKGAIFKCEFMGDNLIRACGRDIAGELIEAAGASFPGSLMHKHLMLIVTTPAPYEDGGFFLGKTGEMVKYRACYLPFGSESRGLTNIIVGLSFRAF